MMNRRFSIYLNPNGKLSKGYQRIKDRQTECILQKLVVDASACSTGTRNLQKSIQVEARQAFSFNSMWNRIMF